VLISAPSRSVECFLSHSEDDHQRRILGLSSARLLGVEKLASLQHRILITVRASWYCHMGVASCNSSDQKAPAPSPADAVFSQKAFIREVYELRRRRQSQFGQDQFRSLVATFHSHQVSGSVLVSHGKEEPLAPLKNFVSCEDHLSMCFQSCAQARLASRASQGHEMHYLVSGREASLLQARSQYVERLDTVLPSIRSLMRQLYEHIRFALFFRFLTSSTAPRHTYGTISLQNQLLSSLYIRAHYLILGSP
jgi:hypothetical protein